MEEKTPTNTKGEYHGYHEWYLSNNTIWFRGVFKYGNEIGYIESNFKDIYSIGEKGTILNFYIR